MTPPLTSRIPGFHRLTVAERQRELATRLDRDTIGALKDGGLTEALCDRFVENAVGMIALPVGIATNFLVNGRSVLVPMAVEEPSVIAAASNAAKMVRSGGGFSAQVSGRETVAQIELLKEGLDPQSITDARDTLLQRANETQPTLVKLGGGCTGLEVREAVGGPGRTVVHLQVDCLDAMGANMVNTMAEAITPLLVQLTGARPGLRILTNLADRRVVTVTCAVPVAALARNGFSGAQVAAGVVGASAFAEADPYRAATHNKGIFNGIDPVLVATGNDWRAVEAGGHAFAARNGRYAPLSTWTTDAHQLTGKMDIPMAVGIVGGASRHHPAAADCLSLMEISSADRLATVVAAAGLAANLAALAALSTEGIQSGHMRLHQKRLSPVEHGG